MVKNSLGGRVKVLNIEYPVALAPPCTSYDSQNKLKLRGGADKSLAPPNSRCRRTESIVSLERGVCSCAELQVFSCYRG